MGHSTGISGLKTGVESLKKDQDLEDWTAHPPRPSRGGGGGGGGDGTPPPKFPGIPPPPPPPGKRNLTFKPNLIQIELTKKERFLLFCSYLPQFNSITVGIVLFSKVDKFH